jgi:hypothetical protein
LLKRPYGKPWPYALAVLDMAPTEANRGVYDSGMLVGSITRYGSAPWLVTREPIVSFGRKPGPCEFGSGKIKFRESLCVAEKFDLASTFDLPGQSKFGPCQKAVRNPAYSDLASDWAKARLPCWRVQKSD